MNDTKQIFEGKKLLVFTRDGWEFAERVSGKSAVVILAITDDDRVLFVEQLRRPVNARVIDFPAGLIDAEGEDGEETARRELAEEAGYTCDTLELLAEGPTSPGITSETIAFYRAEGLEERGEGGGIEGEDITVHRVPLHAVSDWLKRKQGEGILVDVKVWAGLWFLSR